jgi:hypothetical protein
MWGKKTDNLIRFIDQDSLAAIVREAGYKALVKSTEEGGEGYKGDAYIESAQSGWKTFITFFNKTDEGYTTVQFGLCLNDNESKFGIEKMNEFNSQWRFIKGVINPDHSIKLQMDVDLNGGVSREYLVKRASLWDDVLSSFGNFSREVYNRVEVAAEVEREKAHQVH